MTNIIIASPYAGSGVSLYMYNILFSLIVPAGLLILAYIAHPYVAALTSGQFLIVKLVPLLLALITLGLSLRFNRSRLFFSTLSLLLVYIILLWYLPRAGEVDAGIIWQALCLLLPFNLVVFSLLKERGMLTWWGGSRFMLIILEFSLLTGLLLLHPTELQHYLNYPLLAPGIVTWTPLPQPALLTMLVASLFLYGRLFSQASTPNNTQNNALFGALLGSVVMLHFKGDMPASVVFSSAAMLILVVAVIQDSYNMAYIDQLTSLPGRRALNEQMLKLGNNYSIAMLDIDHFKKFNDTYGHDTGDQILRMVAARIGDVGSGGRAFRYGGEEFCILFPGKQPTDVLDTLNEVRERIAGTKFDLRRNDRRNTDKASKPRGKQHATVTISIGVSRRDERKPSPADVIKAADKALYRAKKQGRNRVCK